MRLALRELRRRPNRFVVAAVILTLIALLLVFLGGLLDGLERGNTGALRLQDADAVVFADGHVRFLDDDTVEVRPPLQRTVEQPVVNLAI